MRSYARVVIALTLLFLPSVRVYGQSSRSDLTQLPIEDLMNVDITSVAKKQQKVARTATAVFVITQEDIRRSPATNIPELLRMVPGVQVAQINASTWAVSVRGFNGEYSNKLLVLLDGRSVYLPPLAASSGICSMCLSKTLTASKLFAAPGARRGVPTPLVA